MKKLAYVRVSSIDQNPARQKKSISEATEIDKWYIEKVSGKTRNRPELNKLLDYVRKGDTIYIHSLDRLARNTNDLLNIVEDLNSKGVNLHSLKDSFVFDNSPTGKLMLTVLSAVAEFETNILDERRKEGIAIAKKNGVYKGRKKIKVNQNQLAELLSDWEKGYITKDQIAERLNISRTTLYRRIKDLNL